MGVLFYGCVGCHKSVSKIYSFSRDICMGDIPIYTPTKVYIPDKSPSEDELRIKKNLEEGELKRKKIKVRTLMLTVRLSLTVSRKPPHSCLSSPFEETRHLLDHSHEAPRRFRCRRRFGDRRWRGFWDRSRLDGEWFK